jgi:DNA-binding NarL/FixJ family response regulator
MKSLILFTQDSNLSNLFADSFPEGKVTVHLFDKPLNTIDFSNSVVVIDYEADNVNTSNFLSEVVKASGVDTKVLVVSMDCERKNVADTAKRGAERFIVKPINKKRIKKFIMPYMGAEVTEQAQEI